jgi:iron complex transport system substrate-binding protein
VTGPRIISLLPSATEIAVALGFGDNLVGRSHECDFPPAVAHLPPCTATKVEKGLSSIEIEDRVQAILRQGLSVYSVDSDLLRQLAPDFILTQSHCAICAVTPADLEEALQAWVGTAPTLLSLAPESIEEFWDSIRLVARTLNVEERGEAVVAGLARRLSDLARRTAKGARPRVAALEWIDPIMAAGNWVPQLVEAAGGESLFAATGQHSPWIDWDQLIAADPDVIVFMPCGFQIPQTLQQLAPLVEDPRWRTLSAVRQDRVFIADGHHFFNRPGPRLVESAEMLAEMFHPGLLDFGHHGQAWIRLPRD